jgi:hypothetical protein
MTIRISESRLLGHGLLRGITFASLQSRYPELTYGIPNDQGAAAAGKPGWVNKGVVIPGRGVDTRVRRQDFFSVGPQGL